MLFELGSTTELVAEMGLLARMFKSMRWRERRMVTCWDSEVKYERV